jgi:hypothetical protein
MGDRKEEEHASEKVSDSTAPPPLATEIPPMEAVADEAQHRGIWDDYALARAMLGF